MIDPGKYHTLEILRETSVGLFLGDDTGDEVLLPNKYCPAQFEIGERIEVFVYRDFAERKIATTLTPELTLHQFALLEVVDVTDVGAFVEWGLEKHLLIPFREQPQKLEVGKWYVIYLDLDTVTDRLYGSNKIDQHLQNETLTVAEGDAVELLVYRQTSLGFSVIVNQQHQGLIYANEVFTDIRIGDRLKGFVNKIREHNKLDISLQQKGYRRVTTSNTDMIFQTLVDHDGFLPITDKSPPEEIYTRFGISKKAYKKAIGALYKQRKITISDEGIRVVELREKS